MAYRAGTIGLACVGLADSRPRFECDGCGLVFYIPTDRAPPSWFLNGRAPKGWAMGRVGDVRWDKCPRCRDGAHA